MFPQRNVLIAIVDAMKSSSTTEESALKLININITQMSTQITHTQTSSQSIPLSVQYTLQLLFLLTLMNPLFPQMMKMMM
jgi:hypothetical protein